MIIAVDTGGTKTLIASFSLDGQLLNSQKFPTPKSQSDYLTAVTRSIESIAESQPISGISLALPGVIRQQVAVICKNLDWHNFDVISALKQRWPNVPMWLENDANLGGVGAANLLQPRPARLLYVTISTGVNGGLIIDGKIDPVTAEDELGDTIVELGGQTATWEDLAGGRALSEVYAQPIRELTDPAIKQEIARRIASGLGLVLPIYQPDIVAIGGGVGAHYDMFAPLVEAELPGLNCPIITAPHPEEIVIYGCYFNAKDQLGL